MTGPVLITGGTGSTGRRLAAVLRDRGVAVRVTSRRPAAGQVRFDWADRATHAEVLDGVAAVYVVAPGGVSDPRPVVEPFLAEATRRGVRRVVLLSASAVPPGSPGLGQLHELVQEGCAEPTVLRPSWFMQNFVGAHPLAVGLREHGELVTATGEGRLGFVDAADIAAVAAHALCDAQPHAPEYVITGPEALSYGDAAAVISEITGRRVRHRTVSAAELAERYVAGGYPPEFAHALAELDTAVAAGAEDRTTTSVRDVTGRPPRGFRDFVASTMVNPAQERR